MASVSGATSSLGNTSLRGYGGLGSGIDRDSIIEQMTAGTQSKITNQKNKMTSLGWKQEAYQAVSDKILALQDNYFSFASGTNLKYPSMFAKNQITAMGDSDITKFVSATGSSNMLDYLSILGVKQLASSSTLLSAVKGDGKASIDTNITKDSLVDPVFKSSQLQGRQLRFGIYNGDQYQSSGIFTFPSSYTEKDADGKDKTVSIDYTIDLNADVEMDGVTMKGGEKLAMQLNKALEKSGIQSGDESISEVMEFVYTGGKMQLQPVAGKTTNLVINSSSSALTALGYNSEKTDGTDKDISNGISLDEFNENQKQFDTTYVRRQNMVEYLSGRKLSISFGGQTKEIELIKSGDTFEDTVDTDDKVTKSALDKVKEKMQERLDQAFGSNNIVVEGGMRTDAVGTTVYDSLSFKLGDGVSTSMTLTITSDSAEIRNVLGIQKGASNKLNLEGTIQDNIDKLIPAGGDPDAFLEKLNRDGLVINGVKIKDVTAGTSISDMIEKINANKDVGVKASYLSSSSQFVLVSSETGSGREIKLEGASADMFGAKKDAADNYIDGNFEPGKNAQILVSYGNGINTMIESSSNTFDLEGLRVTVSQEFGKLKEVTPGVWTSEDKSQAVTFSAKADVDGVTETIKKFVEEYNEMIKEINTQVTTRPDKSYGPLTEEQKEEMSEKSVENWEKKAKQGLLYNDATMRALNLDMQGVLTNLMAGGANYKDLEEMGITISDDYLDGGTITFDEAKFKAAMTSHPEKVSDVFTGGGDIKKGLASIIEDTLTPYATKYANRNGNSYGRLIEEAGSEKIPLSIMNNQIYKQLKEMQQVLDTLNTRLASEQDRYISQFTTMETLINQMNSQASYLAQFQA